MHCVLGVGTMYSMYCILVFLLVLCSSGRRSSAFCHAKLSPRHPRCFRSFLPIFSLDGEIAADGFQPRLRRVARLEITSRRATMVGNIRFLTLVKPVLHVLPEVAQPDRKIPFKARLPA